MWSAWLWVYRTASILVMPSRIACSRKSGVVSMRTTLPAYSIKTEGRVRRGCGSVECDHTQRQPNAGLATLFVHDAELQHGAHVERSHEALKGHREFLGGLSAQFDARVEILGGLPIGIDVSLLLIRGRRRGHFRIGGSGRRRRSRRL